MLTFLQKTSCWEYFLDVNSEMMSAQWQQMWHMKNLQAGVFVVTFLSQAELDFSSSFPNHVKFWSYVLSTRRDFK